MARRTTAWRGEVPAGSLRRAACCSREPRRAGDFIGDAGHPCLDWGVRGVGGWDPQLDDAQELSEKKQTELPADDGSGVRYEGDKVSTKGSLRTSNAISQGWCLDFDRFKEAVPTNSPGWRKHGARTTSLPPRVRGAWYPFLCRPTRRRRRRGPARLRRWPVRGGAPQSALLGPPMRAGHCSSLWSQL